MRVGVVLSGGMAKGAYQIGALKAISKYFPPSDIAYMSCSSVGVLNGYSYIAGTLSRAENIWKGLCSSSSRIFISQLLRSSLLQERIKDIYNNKFEIKNNFYCSLLDISSRNIVYKDLSSVTPENVPLYLKASVAMPIYNKAVHIDNHLYFDGAMIDNIPIYPMRDKQVDIVICVYFDDISYKFENDYFDNKVIKVTFPSETLAKQSVVFRKESIDEMINEGFSTTLFIMDAVFSQGTDNLDLIYNRIKRINKVKGKGNLRVTGDMLVTNLNKVTKRLLKKKIL